MPAAISSYLEKHNICRIAFANFEILSKYNAASLLLTSLPLAGNAVSESLRALTKQKLEHISIPEKKKTTFKVSQNFLEKTDYFVMDHVWFNLCLLNIQAGPQEEPENRAIYSCRNYFFLPSGNTLFCQVHCYCLYFVVFFLVFLLKELRSSQELPWVVLSCISHVAVIQLSEIQTSWLCMYI